MGSRQTNSPGSSTGAVEVTGGLRLGKNEAFILKSVTHCLACGGLPTSTDFLTPAQWADIKAVAQQMDSILLEHQLNPLDEPPILMIPIADQLERLVSDMTLRILKSLGLVLDDDKEVAEQAPAAERPHLGSSGPRLPPRRRPAAAASRPGAPSNTSSRAPAPVQAAAADVAALSLSPTGASSSRGGGTSRQIGGGNQAPVQAAAGTTATPGSSGNPGDSGSKHCCHVCGSTTRHDGKAKLLKCTVCKDKDCLYCSPACQKQDWSRHKQTCTPAAGS
jgi:hypothetical protein